MQLLAEEVAEMQGRCRGDAAQIAEDAGEMRGGSRGRMGSELRRLLAVGLALVPKNAWGLGGGRGRVGREGGPGRGRS